MFIDFIFDPSCPWCFIGMRRLKQALALRPDYSVEIRLRYFMIDPEIPALGVDHAAYQQNKLGDKNLTRRLYGALNKAGRSVAIKFNFERIRLTPNSLNAHRLVCYAARRAKADDILEALFQSYFVNGLDIGDIGALAEIGESIGLGKRELTAYLKGQDSVKDILEDFDAIIRQGVNSVPSFVFNGHMIIAGAHEPKVLARLLDAARAEDLIN